MEPTKLLLIEDNLGDARLIREALRGPAGGGFDLQHADRLASGLVYLEGGDIGLVLLDLSLPDSHGLDTVARVRAHAPNVPIVVLTGLDDEGLALQALELGAQDYLAKGDAEGRTLRRTIRYAIERQRAEEILRESERFARSTLDALTAHIAILDETGTIVAVNRAWLNFSQANDGDPQTTSLGVNYLAICDNVRAPNDGFAPEMVAGIRAVMSGAASDFVLEYPCHSPIEQRWFLARVTRFAESGPLRVVVAHENITKRRLAEADLRQSEARFRGLMEAAPDAVMVVDRAGRITFANAHVEKVFGYRTGELLGQPIELLVPERFRQAHTQHRAGYMNTLVARPMDSGLELQGQRQDGSEFDADIMLGPLEQDGELNLLCFVRDITDRKAAETSLAQKVEEIKAMSEQLWQAAKLATMGELAASIAHEINNPLGIVSLRVESVLTQTPADDPRHRELQIVENEVKRMSTLVASLLQFSRRNVPRISTVNVPEEIENTLELIYYHLRQRKITVQREFAADAPLARVDRQQLRQLFLNLFTNASDAMPEGGLLTLRVRPDPTQSQVMVEVADTGAGITPNDLLKVTEPFFTTKPEGKGTGLGLAICRRIVHEHSGTFDIYSAGLGLGTTVRFSLPGNNHTNESYLLEP